jgi:hypothetical protein
MKSLLIATTIIFGSFFVHPHADAHSKNVITSMDMSSNSPHKKKYKVTARRNKHTCLNKNGCQSKTALIHFRKRNCPANY